MAREWEDAFRAWSKAPGTTEQGKCESAESQVRRAIRASSALPARTIEVFSQGSYRNRTNVRADSDVDICVLCTDVCFYLLLEGVTLDETGLQDASYPYADFRSDVERALRDHFGSSAVNRGNKAFDVHETTSRVDADVVACFEHRRYYRRPDGRVYYLSGTELRPDKGGRVINWPQQHYDSGVRKNEATGQRFKAIVRALKTLRNEMDEKGHAAALPIPSYLIECLVWNVPNEGFGRDTYTGDVRYALAYLFNNTIKADHCDEWVEVNQLKYLFRDSQPWTAAQTHAFLGAAWDYIGFQ